MSNSSFVTVQRRRKRLMPAGIEDMLVDLTDVVTQIGLTPVVPRSLRERSTAGVIDGVLASTYASRTGQGLKQIQEWMVAGNMIRQATEAIDCSLRGRADRGSKRAERSVRSDA